MAALEVGIFDTFAPEQATHITAAYEAHIDDARTAEQLGYAYHFFIEHQNARYPVISAPAVFLTALARATTTLRIGAMVFQLPMHHPVRLAQDTAMIDQLSGGGSSLRSVTARKRGSSIRGCSTTDAAVKSVSR